MGETPRDKPYVICRLGDSPCLSLVDTGSSINIISAEVAQSLLPYHKKEEFTDKVQGAGGRDLEVVGLVTNVATHIIPGEIWFSDFVVIKNLEEDVIIGNNTLCKYRVNLNLCDLRLESGKQDFDGIYMPNYTDLLLRGNKGKKDEVYSMIVDEPAYIGPGAQCYIRVRSNKQVFESAQTACIIAWIPRSIAVASKFVTFRDGMADLTVINEDYTRELVIEKDTEIGYVAVIEKFNAIRTHNISIEREGAEAEQEDFWSEDRTKKILDKVSIGETDTDSGVVEKMKNLISEYSDTFWVEGDKHLRAMPYMTVDLKLAHNIPLKSRPARTPHKYRELIEKELNRLMSLGVLTPSDSSYSSKAFFLMKKGACDEDGDPKLRLIVDLRDLNRLIEGKYVQIPPLDEVYSRFGNNVFFCVLDNRTAFYAIAISDATSDATSFEVNGRKFKYARMPLGLSISPFYLSKLVNEMLDGLQENTVSYVDDITVFAKTEEALIDAMEAVFERLRVWNLSLASEKCKFLKKEVRVLGYIISEGKIKPDPGKITALVELREPKSTREARGFLGKVNFFRSCIPNLADKSFGLIQATRIKKGEKFKLDDAARASFESLKSALAEAATIYHPSPDAQLCLRCDASNVAHGSVLYYMDEEEARPIGFHSKVFTEAQRKSFTAVAKELFAIVYALTSKFRAHTLGRHITIYTDSKTLASPNFLATCNNAMFVRWIEKLNGHKFSLIHIAGSDNVAADFLSRSKDPVPDEEIEKSELDLETEEAQNEVIVNLVSCYSSAKLAVEQDKDEKMKKLKLAVSSGKRPTGKEASDYLMRYLSRFETLRVDEENCLLSKFYDEELGDFREVICVPRHLTEILVDTYHRSAHLSRDKLIHLLRERYFFPKLATQAALRVKSCDICQKCNAAIKPKLRGRIDSFIPRLPGDLLCLDFGSILKNRHANHSYNHMLISCDAFSGLIGIYPVKNQNAKTLVDIILNQIIPVHGIPKRINSDKGKIFICKVFEKVCKVLQIEHYSSPPYHAQSNSRAERCVGMAKRSLRKLNLADRDNWYKYCGVVALILNATVRKGQSFSANFVFYGRDLDLPIDSMFDARSSQFYVTEEHYLYDLYHKIELIREIVFDNQVTSLSVARDYYNRKSLKVEFKAGDLCLMRRELPAGTPFRSLELRYIGPYKVISEFATNVFLLEDCKSKKRRVSHHDRLFPYVSAKKANLLEVIEEESENLNDTEGDLISKFNQMSMRQNDKDQGPSCGLAASTPLSERTSIKSKTRNLGKDVKRRAVFCEEKWPNIMFGHKSDSSDSEEGRRQSRRQKFPVERFKISDVSKKTYV